MKKIFAIVLAFSMIFAAAAMNVGSAKADKWDGQTKDISWYVNADPKAAVYEISTAAQYAGLVELVKMSQASNAKYASVTGGIKNDSMIYYDKDGIVLDSASGAVAERSTKGVNFAKKTIKLTSDLDLDNKDIDSLGWPGCFYGTLDGNGKTISNASVGSSTFDCMFNGDRYTVGFVNVANNGTYIKNLTLDNLTLNIKPSSVVTNNATDKRIFAGFICGYVAGSHIEITDVTVQNATVNINPDSPAVNQRIYFGLLCGLNSKTDGNEDSVFNNITIKNEKINGSDYAWLISEENKYFGLATYKGQKFGVITLDKHGETTETTLPEVTTEALTTEADTVDTTAAETTKTEQTTKTEVTTAEVTTADNATTEEENKNENGKNGWVVPVIIAAAVVIVAVIAVIIIKSKKK